MTLVMLGTFWKVLTRTFSKVLEHGIYTCTPENIVTQFSSHSQSHFHIYSEALPISQLNKCPHCRQELLQRRECRRPCRWRLAEQRRAIHPACAAGRPQSSAAQWAVRTPAQHDRPWRCRRQSQRRHTPGQLRMAEQMRPSLPVTVATARPLAAMPSLPAGTAAAA